MTERTHKLGNAHLNRRPQLSTLWRQKNKILMNKTTLSLCKYSSKSISASSLWLRHIWWAYQERQHKGNTQEHVHINWPHTSHFSFQTRLHSPQRGPVLTNLGSEFNLILPQVNTRTKVESVLSLNNIQQSVSPVWGEAARGSAP